MTCDSTHGDIFVLPQTCQQAQYIFLFVQNALLSALLAVVRGLSSPDEERVLSTVRLVTQLWLRMSPEQVRTPETHKSDYQ